MDELFQQIANISKAHGYDILAAQVNDLKTAIRQLIEYGELDDLTFTDEKDTENFKRVLSNAKILSIK